MEKKNNTKTKFSDIEEKVFQEFLSKEGLTGGNLARDLRVKESDLWKIIESHYLLSPQNIRVSQTYLGILVIMLSLTISTIRFGNEYFIIGVYTLIGILLAMPFFIMNRFLTVNFNFKKIHTISIFSLLYTASLSCFFIVVVILSNLYGAIIIPVLIMIFYIIELTKLRKLINKIQVYKNNQL